MLSVDEAIASIERMAPFPDADAMETVPLLQAVGRVLGRDIFADVPIPPFSRSTMDGFALRANDLTQGGATRLKIIGESAAGRPFEGVVGAGETARIFTGAPLPEGADAVCMVEQTTEVDGEVQFEASIRVGQNISREGEDLKPGDRVLAAGRAVSTGHVGMLASVGATRIEVVRRPRVAILTTGSELVSPDETPQHGFIRESNGSALSALVRAMGGEPTLLDRVVDDRADITKQTEIGLGYDLLLVTGGSSVGDYDFTPEVFASLGITTHFDRVAMKPGKPTLFGTRDRTAVFGLPGNPISAFVAYQLFVRPALLRRLGVKPVGPRWVNLPLTAEVSRNRVRDQVLPAIITLDHGTLGVRFAGWNGSGDVTSLRDANGLVRVDAGESTVAVGEIVPTLFLDGGRAGDASFGPA